MSGSFLPYQYSHKKVYTYAYTNVSSSILLPNHSTLGSALDVALHGKRAERRVIVRRIKVEFRTRPGLPMLQAAAPFGVCFLARTQLPLFVLRSMFPLLDQPGIRSSLSMLFVLNPCVDRNFFVCPGKPEPRGKATAEGPE